jgi:GTPase SAR1 family protein
MQEVVQKINQFLAESVDPIQRRFLFQGRPSEATLNDTPMILMIGNHSSGKSSFINYFIRQDIQLTGMAPTDEDFTILRFGPTEQERNGSSVVSNPELGYEGLNQFGPRFLSHLKLKSLPAKRLEKLSLVDTPGMIDSADSQAHRGFDFQGAVRWFAERADLIMLFFDPERPGTTAETLQVYTESLRDFDHKLLVVLNKVDQFRKLSDFARCYGTLCWNLGKVMRTKDLPQIYVTFLPIEGMPSSVLPMNEFVQSRKHLIQKMEQTSLQRVDNILTDVTIYLERLLLHTQVLDTARRWLSGLRRKFYSLATIMASVASAWAFYLSGWEESHVYGTILGSTVFSFFIAHLSIKVIIKQKEWWYTTHNETVFENYATQFRVRNERYQHLKAHWELIGSQTVRALKDLGIARLPKIKKREASAIMKWIEQSLPELRRMVHIDQTQPPTDTTNVMESDPKAKEMENKASISLENNEITD